MIPILNIGTAITSFLTLLIALRLGLAYRKLGGEDVKYFTRTYLFLSLFFAAESLPALVVQNPEQIQYVYILAYVFLYITVAFLALVSLSLIHVPARGRWVFLIGGAAIIITAFSNFLYSKPAFLEILGETFYYWAEGTPVWLQNVNGIIAALGTFAASLVFFRVVFQTQDPWLRARSLLIGLGQVCFVFASLSYFVLVPHLQSSRGVVFIGMFAVFLSVLGGILVLLGVLRKKQVSK